MILHWKFMTFHHNVLWFTIWIQIIMQEVKIRQHRAKQKMSHFVSETNWYFILGALQKMLKVPAGLYNSKSVHPTDDSSSKAIFKKKEKKTPRLLKRKKKKREKEWSMISAMFNLNIFYFIINILTGNHIKNTAWDYACVPLINAMYLSAKN